MLVKPRRTCFELRTDEHGVIRVAKGLFILVDNRRMRELKV
ncbi:type VI secretion system Vgr family protein [Cronobacter dublinensis]